jgi:hypothetical protein
MLSPEFVLASGQPDDADSLTGEDISRQTTWQMYYNTAACTLTL